MNSHDFHGVLCPRRADAAPLAAISRVSTEQRCPHFFSFLLHNLGEGGIISYGYDGNHYLTEMYLKVGSTNGPKVTFSYDSTNRPSGAMITTHFGYDTSDRLATITHKVGATTLALYTYHYDNRDRVDGSTGSIEGTRNYQYDGASQLTAVTDDSQDLETYTYDDAGNRASAGTYTYHTTIGNRLEDDGVYTYVYDNEGNLAMRRHKSSGEFATYTSDYRNRLTTVFIKDGSTTVAYDTFTYDVANRRIGKLTKDGTQVWTAYDGANPYVDFNGSTLTKRYLYGRAVDELFASTNATAGTIS